GPRHAQRERQRPMPSPNGRHASTNSAKSAPYGATGDGAPDLVASRHNPTRLAALRHTALLDTPAEASYDRLTQLSRKVLPAPAPWIPLRDADRLYLKSVCGLEDALAGARELPACGSYCEYAVALGAPLVVEDARAHPWFRDNSTLQAWDVVAYLGVPLVLAN